MRSDLSKIVLLVFILFLFVSCTTVIHTGPPRPRPHYAVWVDDHWGPHGYWVPGHWAIR